MSNVESGTLMWFVAEPEVFEDVYGVYDPGTPLQSGKRLIHMSKCGGMAARYSGDHRVRPFTQEGLELYLTYADTYLGADQDEVI